MKTKWLTNIRIHYPADWFAESKNLEPFQLVRIFPKEFMAEQYLPVAIEIMFLNGIDSSVNHNLTQMVDLFGTQVQRNPDARMVNSITNATLFNGTVPAFLEMLSEYCYSLTSLEPCLCDLIPSTIVAHLDYLLLQALS